MLKILKKYTIKIIFRIYLKEYSKFQEAFIIDKDSDHSKYNNIKTI